MNSLNGLYTLAVLIHGHRTKFVQEISRQNEIFLNTEADIFSAPFISRLQFNELPNSAEVTATQFFFLFTTGKWP